MPTISRFYGILIQMYFGDHVPPHFHALYAEYEAVIDIRTLAVLRGELPSRAMALILEWAQLHRNELLKDWDLCARNQQPEKILPLP
ncbi:MAG TPA: DUF4160 domain-containing protein [Silvibacterium sp.]|nr:DUF4160 domain-containing protein [Silvibacterium sp.]